MNKVFVIQEKFIKITKFLDYGNLEISSLKLSSAGIIDDNLMNLVYSYKKLQLTIFKMIYYHVAVALISMVKNSANFHDL